jgi:hypothetical protein
MKVKFVPSTMPAGYTGHIILRLPTYAERLELLSDDLMDETGLVKPGEEPQTEEEIKAKAKQDTRRARILMQSVAKKLPDFVSEVKIVREKDGHKFEDFDALQYESEMMPVLTEICTRVIGKNEVGSPP